MMGAGERGRRNFKVLEGTGPATAYIVQFFVASYRHPPLVRAIEIWQHKDEMGRSDNEETKNKKRNTNAMYLFSMIRLQGSKMMLIKLILDNEKVVLIKGPYKRVCCDNRPQKFRNMAIMTDCQQHQQ
uniref:Uncharacterized protein n=1 Tax=Parascaris univalens TaxID=6257 RepID=A0A915CHL1_PARUN